MVPQWPTQAWYLQLIRMLIEEPLLLPKRDSILHSLFDPERCHSWKENQTDGLSVIRSALKNQRISQAAQKLILSSWRQGTQKPYRTYLNKWQCYAGEQSINPFQPPVNKVLEFLNQPYEQGLGYSGINTAGSALSSITTLEGNVTIGKHPLVQRLVKRVLQCRPSFPRYERTWDTNVVLKYLKILPDLKQNSLCDLTYCTYKLMTLCSLITGQRCSFCIL